MSNRDQRDPLDKGGKRDVAAKDAPPDKTPVKADDKKADDKKADDKKADDKKADDKKAERKSETLTPRKSDTGLPSRRLFVDPSLHVIDALDAEAVAIGVCSDVRPLAGAAGFIDWRMCGKLSALLRRGTVTGAAGEKVLLPTHGMIPAARIFTFGWGPKAALLDNAVKRLDWMADVLNQAGVQRVAIALPEPAGILIGLVEEHLKKPLGERLSIVFSPDSLMGDAKDTRPIPAAPPPATPAPST